MNSVLYAECLADVVRWNAVGRNNDTVFTEEQIKNQTAYTQEEVLETIAGIANKDMVAILDGLADSMVTLGYKLHMVSGGKSHEYAFEVVESYNSPYAILSDACYILNVVDGADEEFHYLMNNDLLSIMVYYSDFGHDVFGACCEILKSNWSKFPKHDMIEDIDAECKWIEENRGKTAIGCTVVNVDGIDYLVFRDNHGSGKIAKPSCFVEPDLLQFVK